MKATRCRIGSATHAQRRAAIGGARRNGAGQRRRRLECRAVEDVPELGQIPGPKGHDWSGWDAGLKAFFRQK
jgi:hypothetical protein